MRIGLSVRTQSPKDAVRGASPCRLRKKRMAAAEAKRHSDRLESAAYMRRADAEAKAMAIGNIADVLRIKTVSPLQKMCVPLRAGKVCCIQGRGAGGLQHGNF